MAESKLPQMRWPAWIGDILRSLPVRSHFVLSGNIRDFYLVPSAATHVPMPILPCLWEAMASHGYQFLCVYDKVDGLYAFPDGADSRSVAGQLMDLKFENGHKALSLKELPRCMKRVISAERRIGFVIDYASRLAGDPQHLTEPEQEFFLACEKLSQRPQANNVVIWLIDREHDLPAWFIVGNEGVQSIAIPRPDFDARRAAAALYGPYFRDFGTYPPDVQNSLLQTFADLTEGMTLRSIGSITALATQGDKDSRFAEIANLVRCFKVGMPDNPWKKDHMRGRIRAAPELIAKRVKGQSKAVEKTLDCLKRSVLGLTGAQATGSSGRPRGVLFFAGPTGVGKTELAKAITSALFGDEKAYIRFDMSEFSAEHSDARLIGSPPGYEGHQSGGELTNAIRRRPASVVLFDEIEKSHPRILDKFLQILEDGRLTDGRGDTVYFSEAIIIFTSNLGIYVREFDDDGQFIARKQNVAPGMTYIEVERKVREAIEHHFRFELSRPELLNRLGDNIIVFNFIEPDIAVEIFDKMLGSVKSRLADEHKVELVIPDEVRSTLLKQCTTDLANGGRGIGNQLEATFINPLSRAIFAMADLEERRRVTVRSIEFKERSASLELA